MAGTMITFMTLDRPKNTELRKLVTTGILYERFSKHDPMIKLNRKVSGRFRSKIRLDSLISAKRRLPTAEHLLTSPI